MSPVIVARYNTLNSTNNNSKNHSRAVDFVHGVLDTLVGIEIGNQHIHNLKAVTGHGVGQGILNRQRQFFFGFKHCVQFLSLMYKAQKHSNKSETRVAAQPTIHGLLSEPPREFQLSTTTRHTHYSPVWEVPNA